MKIAAVNFTSTHAAGGPSSICGRPPKTQTSVLLTGQISNLSSFRKKLELLSPYGGLNHEAAFAHGENSYPPFIIGSS